MPRSFSLHGFGPWLCSAIVLIVIGLVVHGNTVFTILNLIAINCVFALSYNMQLGQTGLLSFGQAMFYGLGGFAAIHAMNAIGAGAGFWGHFPVMALPAVGFAAGGAVAFVVGWPFCRHGGLAFAMITLGLGLLTATLTPMFPSFFGGAGGVFSDRTAGPVWFGLKLIRAGDVYWVMAFWTFVAALVMWALARTPLGRMANAVRDNHVRVRFLGYKPRNIRFIMFVASGAFSGMAGGMASINFEIVTSDAFSLLMSAAVLLMAAIGGLGLFYGPILGAVLVTLMQSLLSDYTQASTFYIGLVFLAIIMFAPGGLAGGLDKIREARAAGELRKRLPAWGWRTFGSVLIAFGLITLVELLNQIHNGPDDIVKMVGLSLDPRAPWGWIAMVVLLATGYGVFKATRQSRAIDK